MVELHLEVGVFSCWRKDKGAKWVWGRSRLEEAVGLGRLRSKSVACGLDEENGRDKAERGAQARQVESNKETEKRIRQRVTERRGRQGHWDRRTTIGSPRSMANRPGEKERKHSVILLNVRGLSSPRRSARFLHRPFRHHGPMLLFF